MLRTAAFLLILLGSCTAVAQLPGSDSTAALHFSRSLSVPLNAVQLYDQALAAWTWTFGKEPGATLRRSDREQGVIEGTARMPFRSEMLVGREESMGVVQFRISIHVKAGECRTVISELTHSGNRTTPNGGIHLGLLTKGELPPRKVTGLGRTNLVRLYAEVKNVGTAHVTALMQAFEARLRANLEP
ncbi:MAG: hypothetical protein KF905_16790 [Flavobacteriales bacterium]|nr:hypothetical protein [Flavobacteriales bacterium]